MEEEIWIPIPGYEGDYQVSNYGKVKTFRTPSARKIGGRILKATMFNSNRKSSGNFVHLLLCGKDGKRDIVTLNKLVALNFVPNPNNYHFVINIDGNKSNSHYQNLKWVKCVRKSNNTPNPDIKYIVEIMQRIKDGDSQYALQMLGDWKEQLQ